MSSTRKEPRQIKDISITSEQLAHVDLQDLLPLPSPYDKPDELPQFKPLTQAQRDTVEATLDDTAVVGLPKVRSSDEQEKLIKAFVLGLRKLFSPENNWTFLKPLVLSMEHCAHCQTCADSCPIYEASGHNEVYRPTFRAEVLRRLYFKYVKPGGGLYRRFQHGDIELNWTLMARLLELSYRCTLCRRCAQSCPIGVDNGLITREIRKLFSSELGIAQKDLHEKGTLQQLRLGSSTGMNPRAVKDTVDFIDQDMTERTGIEVKSKWDVEGADILLLHNAGEFISWPENHGSFALLLDAAGISWTLSSDLVGYDGVNYGLFYDDVQLARIAYRHLEVAKKLKVKKILMGECGHENKALGVTADRLFQSIPRETSLALLEQIVFSGRIKFDPSRNDFPVTLHDPCNLTRSMGIIQPQRRVLRRLAPQFREMEPHGVHNYCCGGGGGFAIMSPYNFQHWRMQISGRKKFKQILDAFADTDLTSPSTKYVCAPCSNCKGQMRDILDYFGAKQKSGIHYGGLVELVVNAMADVKRPFLNFEER